MITTLIGNPSKDLIETCEDKKNKEALEEQKQSEGKDFTEMFKGQNE